MALIGHFKSQMLWDNIGKGDLSAVVNLLENGTINLEERDENGQTFLMVACQKAELSIVRELLEAGQDPNDVDNSNWTALLYAAREGHLEIVIELLERGANIEHRDLVNWTALMWACYKGRDMVVKELLDRGADPNIKAEHNMSCLGWAAGRGHLEVVRALIQKGARINTTDKYGTTPLIWACRKGHVEIVQELLDNGASVDNAGMDSLTALLVATKGGFTEVVQALLEFDPNPNAIDKDGFTALTIATKEGYETIVQELLAKDAYVNLADRAGDTILIHAVKGGNVNIVRALLNRYADVDVEGSERRTALYWAVDKGHVEIVRLLLNNDADKEISNKDGDTPLMKAVRNRHEMIVRMLLDKGAKVSVFDKKGDSALHISLRARSKRITELLLRNPRNSRLLYRPNKSGETPYSIDAYHQKSILTQIHGHRQLNASDGENLLGYEIYSSSLADILSEPSLNTPITVGLYAKWGSGKSFLIGKLKSEMQAFTVSNEEMQLHFTLSLLIVLLLCNSLVGSILALTISWQLGLGVGLGLFVWEYGFLGLILLCSTRYNVRFAQRISHALGKRLQILALLFQLLFCNPVQKPPSTTDVPLVKFLFTEGTKLTSVGGEKALAAMIAGLSEAVEKEFGFFSSRLFSVLKPMSAKNYIGRFKTICCIPVFVIVIFLLLDLITGIALLVTHGISDEVVNIIMGVMAGFIGIVIFVNVPNFGRSLISITIPQRKRIMKAADNLHKLKLDGFLQTMKVEVRMMNRLVTCMDSFTRNTTRLVVVVDGLDTCEQEKVLQVLDIIHALFNEDDSHFVTVLAVDPQIIIKGIDQNLKTMFQDVSVNGFDYLRNIVHLPFYLQSQGLQVKRQEMVKSVSLSDINHESPTRHHKGYRHQDSNISHISGSTVSDSKKSHKQNVGDSLTHIATSNFDISHTLTKNDYFSDINPKSMRRLMNIVAVTGRLLRAYNIDFNWYRLAGWVNLVEQWPYRLSWLILYFEESDKLDDEVTLEFIYNKIKGQVPVSSEVEPLLEIDRNVRKLEVFLSSKSNSPVLTISDLKKFLPCTINLDPYLRKLIKNLQQQQLDLPLMFNQTPGGPGGAPENSDRLSIRPTLPRVASKSSLSSQMQNSALQYGHMSMMYPPHMVGMSPYVMQGMPGYGAAGYGAQVPPQEPRKKSVDPGKYIRGYKREILSRMNVSDVSNLLGRLSGINMRLLIKYQQSVVENNINGLVLSTCDIDDLGKCLEMKFGDWQLFRSAVLSLRDAEHENYSPGSDKGGSDASSSSQSDKSRPSSLRTVSGMRNRSDSDLMKGRSSVRRQVSINLPKEEIIQEEEEVSTPPITGPLSRRMKRNDSLVDEMMYESGLLHSFVHKFTENNSTGGEDDDDDDDDDMNVDDLLVGNDAQERRRGLPIQFTISSDGSPTSHHSDLEPGALAGHKSEREPLIGQQSDKTAKDLTIHTVQVEAGNQHAWGSQSSLNLSQISDEGNQDSSDLVPLMTFNETNDTGSFKSEYSTRSHPGNLELMTLVDETQKDQGSSQEASSIHQTLTTAMQGSGQFSSGNQSIQNEAAADAQLITGKDVKKDKNTPESFV